MCWLVSEGSELLDDYWNISNITEYWRITDNNFPNKATTTITTSTLTVTSYFSLNMASAAGNDTEDLVRGKVEEELKSTGMNRSEVETREPTVVLRPDKTNIITVAVTTAVDNNVFLNFISLILTKQINFYY